VGEMKPLARDRVESLGPFPGTVEVMNIHH
jgi:hypothetical protein